MSTYRPMIGMAGVLLLAACAAPATPPSASQQQRAAAVENPDLTGPGLPLRMAMTGRPARMLLEKVAATCWLDQIVHGATMLVDRRTGRIVISSPEKDLLIADISPIGDGTSLVRLTGPLADDPAITLRLSKTLGAAVGAGRPVCEPVTG